MLLTEENRRAAHVYWKRKIQEKCTICNGLGYIVKLDGNHQSSKDCECIKKVNTNINLEDWGIPRKFLDVKWNLDLIKDKSYMNDIKDYIINFQDYFDQGIGIFLSGAHGRGKSTIECIIAKGITRKINPDYNRPYNVAFSLFEDIIQWSLHRDMYPNIKLEDFLYKSDVLILDNIGNETGQNSNYSLRILELILRKRDNNMLPTIISSNDSLDDLRQKYSNDIADFIMQDMKQLYISGENHRQRSSQVNNNAWNI